MDMRFSLFANLRLGCSGKSAGVFLVFPCKGGICKWSSSQIWSWALKGLFCNQLIKILVVVKHYAGRKPSASPGSYCHCHSFRVLFVHAFSLFRSHSGSQKSIASNSISLNLELNPPAIKPWADVVSSCISVYLHPIGQWFIEIARSYAETFWDLKPSPGISTDLSQELSNCEQCYSMLQWKN